MFRFQLKLVHFIHPLTNARLGETYFIPTNKLLPDGVFLLSPLKFIPSSLCPGFLSFVFLLKVGVAAVEIL